MLDAGLEAPSYAHPGDAGADLRAREDVVLQPGERKLVPTGVSIALPDGFVALIHPRSGLATKHGLTIVNAPGTVDAGYRGEISVTLLNTDSRDAIELRRGDRIAQMVIQRVEYAQFVPVNELSESVRGTGGFGSTGGFSRPTPELHDAAARRCCLRAATDFGGTPAAGRALSQLRRQPHGFWARQEIQEGTGSRTGRVLGGAESAERRKASQDTGRRAKGPFDVSEISSRDGYVDLGALLIAPSEGLQLRLEVEEATQRVVAVTMDLNGSSLQLQAFAAPKTEGLWDEIREQIGQSVGSQGGQVEEVQGPSAPNWWPSSPPAPRTEARATGWHASSALTDPGGSCAASWAAKQRWSVRLPLPGGTCSARSW